MKKHLFFIAIFIFTVFSVNAQSWQWAICEQQTNGEGYSVARDPQDNVFLMSVLGGTAMIGSQTFTFTGGKTICSKYDPNGTNLWNFEIRANAGVYPSVACDNAGNAYIAAIFSGTITIASNTYVSAGSVDFLLVKLDANGNFIWAQTGGGSSIDYFTNIAVDAVGNSYVCGYSSSTLATIGANTISCPSSQMVVAKFDANGNNIWAVTTNTAVGQISKATSISIDNANNIYVGGNYSTIMSGGTQTISAVGGQDAFIAKLNSVGNFIWLQSLGGAGLDQCNDVQVDPSGDIYAVGAFSGTNAAIAGSVLTSTGSNDAWFTKLNASGTYLWTRQVGSGGNEIGYSVAPYSGGVFFATSVLSPTIQIGANSYTSTTQDGMGFVQYDAAGNMQYATTIGGGGDDILDICQANGCTIYVGGDLFISPCTIGTSVLTKTTSEALLLARFQMSSSMPTVTISGPSAICAGNSVTLTAGGASTYTWSTGAVSNSIVIAPNSSSVVTVIGAGPQYTCSSTQAHSIQVSVTPTVSIAVTNPTICQGATTTLTASGATTYAWNSGQTNSVIIVSPLQNTVYVATGSVPGGCTNSAQQLINVMPTPTITLVPTSTLVCKNAKITFTVSGANTYTWNNNTHLPTLTFTATANTTVSVAATGFGNTCTVSATRQLSISTCAGIDELNSAEKAFIIYPNPSSSAFYIQSETAASYVVSDAMGKSVFEFNAMAQELLKIDSSELPAGIYFITSKDAAVTKKLVKTNE